MARKREANSTKALEAAATIGPHSNGSEEAGAPLLSVSGVRQTPQEVWASMLRFSGPNKAEQEAMRQTVDVLFQRGYELVVNTYDHLQRFPETAEVLGWQEGADESHLAERRRFFTIWLARTLSMDFGAGFGDYLFYAGKVHAAHGPRRILTPSIWVTGSIGLVLGAFSDFILSAHSDARLVAQALTGWNKYLLVQLNQMQMGYELGMELDQGAHAIELRAYAMVRHLWGRDHLTTHFDEGASVADVLRKALNYAPELRSIMFDESWESHESDVDLWVRVRRSYTLKSGWRVQLNGRNLTFHGGFDQPLKPGDEITLFSPGR